MCVFGAMPHRHLVGIANDHLAIGEVSAIIGLRGIIAEGTIVTSGPESANLITNLNVRFII
ncbi:hypothetical protein Brsp01_10210 [Brucella sp. NBRC 12950]|nr:hypothetical protein Brsp01_10210 [Brucella sp. NBRC 12950]